MINLTNTHNFNESKKSTSTKVANTSGRWVLFFENYDFFALKRKISIKRNKKRRIETKNRIFFYVLIWRTIRDRKERSDGIAKRREASARRGSQAKPDARSAGKTLREEKAVTRKEVQKHTRDSLRNASIAITPGRATIH